jgi:hypothetical protein
VRGQKASSISIPQQYGSLRLSQPRILCVQSKQNLSICSKTSSGVRSAPCSQSCHVRKQHVEVCDRFTTVDRTWFASLCRYPPLLPSVRKLIDFPYIRIKLLLPSLLLLLDLLVLIIGSLLSRWRRYGGSIHDSSLPVCHNAVVHDKDERGETKDEGVVIDERSSVSSDGWIANGIATVVLFHFQRALALSFNAFVSLDARNNMG